MTTFSLPGKRERGGLLLMGVGRSRLGCRELTKTHIARVVRSAVRTNPSRELDVVTSVVTGVVSSPVSSPVSTDPSREGRGYQVTSKTLARGEGAQYPP